MTKTPNCGQINTLSPAPMTCTFQFIGDKFCQTVDLLGIRQRLLMSCADINCHLYLYE